MSATASKMTDKAGRRIARAGFSALLLAAGGLLAVEEPSGPGEPLLPGQPLERAIMAEERHVYWVEVGLDPVLVQVQQQGVSLVVEAQGPAARFATGGGLLRRGALVLLLEAAGEHRIEVHPRDPSVGPGRYTLQAEPALALAEGHLEALSLMSRGGQAAFEKTPEGRRLGETLFRQALTKWQALGRRRWEAECLDAIAILEAEDRELPAAVADYSRALALWRELGDAHREAATANELGLNLLYTGETTAAREALESALDSWQRLGERFDEAQTRTNLCWLEQTNGSLPVALACYEEARATFRELGDRSQEGRLLAVLGGVYDLQGEPDAALDHYRQALALFQAVADRRGEAQVLNNMAVVHRVLGEWQEALRIYDQMREVLLPLEDRMLEGARLSNVGVAYNNLGEPQRALVYLEDALKLRREIHDQRGEVITASGLGDAWRRLGDRTKALDHLRQALELATSLGDSRQAAIISLRLAEVQLEAGEPLAALGAVEPALATLAKMGLGYRQAQALALRGRALAAAGRPLEARPVLEDALARRRDSSDRAGEAETLTALAGVERALGLRDQARAHAEEAVARVEELRTGFASPDLRAAFLATQRGAYSQVIDLLMEQHAADPAAGHDRAALAVSERARARSLLDVLSADTAHAGSVVPASLLERRQTLRRRLSAKADQQLKQGGARAESLARESARLLAELDGVEAEIRRLDPFYAAAAAPAVPPVEEIARLLDPDTLLLEYSLGEDRSYLWAIGVGFLRSATLPPEREIEALVRQAYQELSTLEAGSPGSSGTTQALSRLLLGPAEDEVARRRRLVVVPDGALNALPFGVLPGPAGEGLLLEQVEIAYLPSATTLALERRRLEHRPPAEKWAAVLADPVFAADDPRLAGSTVAGPQATNAVLRSGSAAGDLSSALERLPSSRREAEAMASLAPPGQVWTALDLAASRETVLSGGLRGYRVVHFATHGLADLRDPELSGLVLSLVDAAGQPREGLLTLPDIYELELDADLVVLSGCRTALGKEVRGEGLMGLTRGFLYAGVPRVVASLWRVPDRATAELMSRFYRSLWQDHLPAAAALREAQRSLRRLPQYRDPYSWAGFVLQGDWR